MKTKKVTRERDEHGPSHVTPVGRSVFYDLFPKAEAVEFCCLRGPGSSDHIVGEGFLPASPDMVQSNAYGQDFGRSFDLSEAPALISRVLKKTDLAGFSAAVLEIVRKIAVPVFAEHGC